MSITTAFLQPLTLYVCIILQNLPYPITSFWSQINSSMIFCFSRSRLLHLFVLPFYTSTLIGLKIPRLIICYSKCKCTRHLYNGINCLFSVILLNTLFLMLLCTDLTLSDYYSKISFLCDNSSLMSLCTARNFFLLCIALYL